MLTKSQVKAILDKTEVFDNGHFAVDAHTHSAQSAHPMRVLQQPEYATKLAATLGTSLKSLRAQVVLVGPGTGALVGLELARALHARLVYASPDAGRWAIAPGQTIQPDERVVLCEALLTDEVDLAGRLALVESVGATVAGCGVMIDRTIAPWPHPWPLESLVRPEVPLVPVSDCPQCQAGEPLTAFRTTVLS